MADTTSTIKTAATDFKDGLAAAIFLKDDLVVDNIPKRLGVGTPYALAGMFIQGALTRKGLKQLNNVPVANQVVENTPGGGIFIRAL